MEPIPQAPLTQTPNLSGNPANSKVVPYNYKLLAPDDPLRQHIESLLANCKPMKPIIEGTFKANKRKGEPA